MSTTTTTKNMILSTALAVPLLSFQPVLLANSAVFPHDEALTRLDIPKNFESGYKIIDHRIVRDELVDEVKIINSLLEIGNVLFKDAKGETPADMKAKRAYFKSKYRKV